MLSNTTIYRIARNRLNITRIIFIVCLIELLLNGIRIRPLHGHNLTIYIIASVLILLGNIIRSWAAGIVHKRMIIADTGPYGLWRHPLYLGSALVAVGFGLLLNDLFCWVGILLLFLLVYPITIKKEEIDMREMHQQKWVDYTSKVGLLAPHHLDIAKINNPWSYRQYLKNKEYNALLASSIAWILILIIGLIQR
ncbi:MAG: hypothetical protein PWP64_1707 [Candidatus Cloacimonadota bacterium]|nr:hypothetical protein [Candidatus Cloacimonadota bacterium]